MMTNEQLNSLIETVSDELLKRGFKVKLNIQKILPDGKIKIVSDDFQTTPVLYKRIYIEAAGQIKSEEQKNSLGKDIVRHSISFALYAKVESFSGGSNGINLFPLTLVCFNNDDRVKIV